MATGGHDPSQPSASEGPSDSDVSRLADFPDRPSGAYGLQFKSISRAGREQVVSDREWVVLAKSEEEQKRLETVGQSFVRTKASVDDKSRLLVLEDKGTRKSSPVDWIKPVMDVLRKNVSLANFKIINTGPGADELKRQVDNKFSSTDLSCSQSKDKQSLLLMSNDLEILQTAEQFVEEQKTSLASAGANEDKEKTKYKIFVIGKTGTGKSSLCNTITRTDEFPTGRAFSQIIRYLQQEETNFSGLHITVVDTPDISTEDEAKQKETVKTWKESAKGYNYMIVLTVRCDTRYSPAEYEVYKQIKQVWGKDLCKRLVVAFTFGDAREDQSRDMKEELKGAWEELKNVMKDAGERYVVFNNKPGNREEPPVTRLVEYMQKLKGPEVGRWNEITSIFTGWASRFACRPSSTVSSSTSTVSPNSNTASPSST